MTMFAAQQHERLLVRWDNFHASLSQDLAALLREGEMADVTLVADGRVLRAHRIVLALASPYFKDVLKADPDHHPIVILKDVGYQELADVLEFMYRGEVSVCSTGLEAFLKVAEALRVKGLTEDGASQVPVAARPRKASSNKDIATRQPAKRTRTASPAPGVHEPPASSQGKVDSTLVVKCDPEPIMACDVDIEAGEAECYDQSSSMLFENPSGALFSHSPTMLPLQNPQVVSRGALFSHSPTILPLQNPQVFSEESFSFVESRIGTPQLVHNDFIFKTHCSKGSKIYWQCTDYKKHKCRARAMTDKGRVTVMCAQHTHAPHTLRIQGRNTYQFSFYE